MALSRFLFGTLLAATLASPVWLMTLEVIRSPGGFSTWADAGKMAGPAANTLALAGGAVLIAVPFGVIAAVLLERLPSPGRGILRGLVVVGLFAPLPVYAVAWQVVLGTWLPPLTLEPGEVTWRPWAQGLIPAMWVHGTAGLPWVVWIVGAGLRSTDPGLEETALLEGGPNAVFRRVVLPRAALGGLAAACWVAVQTGTEITVTDAMMVRTFAEEVYTQFIGASDGLAGAVAVTIPVWLLSASVAVLITRPIFRIFGEPQSEARTPAPLKYRPRVRVLAAVWLWVGAIAFAGLPLAALVWKAGGGGTRVGWEAVSFVEALAKQLRADGGVLAGSVGSAAMAGTIAAVLAWVACWIADGSRWFARFLFLLCVLLWVTPGPLVGLGLKDAINMLLDAEDWLLARCSVGTASAILRPLLYDSPSPVPATWAVVIRLFPVAVAVLWPAVRSIPQELQDAAKLDGLGVVGTWRRVVIPLTGPGAARTVVAVAALALGEVSASKLVNPPGRSAYVLRLFDQMHYGAESTVAALALLQIAATAGAAGLLLRRSESSFSPGRKNRIEPRPSRVIICPRRCNVGNPIADDSVASVERVCQFIRDNPDPMPTLRVLGDLVGLSPAHLQRTFKRVTGVSPKQYADACRVDRLRAGLKQSRTVTAAMVEAGYGSSSRLYEKATGQLGMTPRAYQKGGPTTAVRFTISACDLGFVLLAGTEKGVCAVSLGSTEGALEAWLRTEFPAADITRNDADLAGWLRALLNHLAGDLPHPGLPFDVRGTAFQRRVWEELRKIPWGETRTYTEVAAALGTPKAVRAVARACATNPVSVLTPCHRVVGTDGTLRGYRWGLERKQRLLEQEKHSGG